jgi:DGQHR domain-containing protein
MSESSSQIILSAVKVKQPIGDFFLAVLSAWELNTISYADVRRMEKEQTEKREVEKYLGVQRPLRDDRVIQIKNYVKGPDASFPTSVILSINPKCAEWDEDRLILTLKPYVADPSIPDDVDIPTGKIAQILDGQHRVKGLEDWHEDWGDFQVPVSIFVGADLPTQATIFATVNLTQTKVNRSLAYDLFELAETRSPQKTCHNIAVLLDSTEGSPLLKRIKRLGVATAGRDFEPLTQATFVESLLTMLSPNPNLDRQILLARKHLSWPTPTEIKKHIYRTLFIEAKDEIIAKALSNYFEAVEKKWPIAWNDSSRGAVLPKTNGFRALMRVHKLIHNALNKPIGEIGSRDEFSLFLDKSNITDNNLNTSTYPPGTSGEAKLFNELKVQLDI